MKKNCAFLIFISHMFSEMSESSTEIQVAGPVLSNVTMNLQDNDVSLLRNRIKILEEKLAVTNNKLKKAMEILRNHNISLNIKTMTINDNQVSAVRDFVKKCIWPKIKVANEETFDENMELIDDVITHLKMEDHPNKYLLYSEIKWNIRDKLSDMRKHKREMIKKIVFGKFLYNLLFCFYFKNSHFCRLLLGI